MPSSFAPIGRISDQRCVSLIGIAGAGKTTLGKALAARLDWAHLDTDRLIEATWGQPLQSILDQHGTTGFLAIEEAVVSTLSAKRTVISTGGSVVYCPKAMARLKTLGPVVHLRITLSTFLARVQDASGRGFVCPDGLTFQDVFNEREPLYQQARDFEILTGAARVEDCVEACAQLLADVLARPQGE